MKMIRGNLREFIPAAHEDPVNPGVLKKILLKKDEISSGRIQMINWAKIPVGKSFTSHHHQDMEEIFIIISGTAELVVGDEKETLEASDTVIIPEKHDHLMKNIGVTDVEYIVIGVTRSRGGKTIPYKQ